MDSSALAIAFLLVFAALLPQFIRNVQREWRAEGEPERPANWPWSDTTWQIWKRGSIPLGITLYLGMVPIAAAGAFGIDEPVPRIVGFVGTAFFVVGWVLILTCGLLGRPRVLIPPGMRDQSS